MADKDTPKAVDSPETGDGSEAGTPAGARVDQLVARAMDMKNKASQFQEDLAALEAEGQAADGLVKATCDGTGRLRSVKIDPQLTDGPVAVLEEMILTAVEDARLQVKAQTSARLKGLTGDLPLPRSLMDLIGSLLPDR